MPDILMFDWRLDKAIEYNSPIKFEPRWIPIPDLPLRVTSRPSTRQGERDGGESEETVSRESDRQDFRCRCARTRATSRRRAARIG